MKNKLVILFVLLLAVISCNKNPTSVENTTTFNIAVITGEPGNFVPVSGATVSGGANWQDYFWVTTDQNGIAKIPVGMKGMYAYIYKDNFRPDRITCQDARDYWIGKARDSLQVLGMVEGAAIKMTPSKIITLDEVGVYRIYSYSSSSVLLESSIKLNDSISTLHTYKIYGDTLWVSSHLQGLYIYSISDNTSPVFLNKIPCSGGITSFAVKDTLVAYIDYFNTPQLSIVSLGSGGQVNLLGQIESAHADEMKIIDTYLYLLGNFSWPNVYDISNPVLPVLLCDFMEPECQGGFFYKNKLFIGPLQYDVMDFLDPANYKVRDISVPSSPVDYSVFRVGGVISGILNDTLAYGRSGIVSSNGFIFSGGPDSSYNVVASLANCRNQTIYNMFRENSFIVWPYLVLGSKVCQYVPR